MDFFLKFYHDVYQAYSNIVNNVFMSFSSENTHCFLSFSYDGLSQQYVCLIILRKSRRQAVDFLSLQYEKFTNDIFYIIYIHVMAAANPQRVALTLFKI